jgi:hypothetical protein
LRRENRRLREEVEILHPPPCDQRLPRPGRRGHNPAPSDQRGLRTAVRVEVADTNRRARWTSQPNSATDRLSLAVCVACWACAHTQTVGSCARSSVRNCPLLTAVVGSGHAVSANSTAGTSPTTACGALSAEPMWPFRSIVHTICSPLRHQCFWAISASLNLSFGMITAVRWPCAATAVRARDRHRRGCRRPTRPPGTRAVRRLRGGRPRGSFPPPRALAGGARPARGDRRSHPFPDHHGPADPTGPPAMTSAIVWVHAAFHGLPANG